MFVVYCCRLNNGHFGREKQNLLLDGIKAYFDYNVYEIIFHLTILFITFIKSVNYKTCNIISLSIKY